MMKALIPISNMFFPFYFIPISNNEDIKENLRKYYYLLLDSYERVKYIYEQEYFNNIITC